MEAEAEELHAQGVPLGAARLSGDDLGGSVVPVVEQFRFVVVHGQEEGECFTSSVFADLN